MLRYYFTRQTLPKIQPPFSWPIEFQSAASFTGNVVPLSHIYISSGHFSHSILNALGQYQSQLEPLNPQIQQSLEQHRRFPQNFKNRGFTSITELHNTIKAQIGKRDTVRFVVINGIGNGLGDNLVGLGILQRLSDLLAPLKAEFHLMQELPQRIETVYQHENHITVANCIMSVADFMNHDFYVDMDSLENMPDIDQTAAAHYNAHAFSINKLVSNNLQPQIVTSQTKTKRLKASIADLFDNQQKTVLLHPLASSQLRTMPAKTAAQLVQALIAAGFNVVSAFPHDNAPDGFADLSEYSNSTDDLIHIINAVDAVVSVGTVVYHIAAALSKPTLLLPTVQPDIRSADLLPEVIAWVPESCQSFVQNLHKSDKPEHLAIANQFWESLDTSSAVEALQEHIQQRAGE